MKASVLIFALALSNAAFADGRDAAEGAKLTCGDLAIDVADDGLSMTIRNERLNVGGVAQINWLPPGGNYAELVYPGRADVGSFSYNPGDDKFIYKGIKCD